MLVESSVRLCRPYSSYRIVTLERLSGLSAGFGFCLRQDCTRVGSVRARPDLSALVERPEQGRYSENRGFAAGCSATRRWSYSMGEAWFNFSIFAGDKTRVAGVERAIASEPPARQPRTWGRRPSGVDPSHPRGVSRF